MSANRKRIRRETPIALRIVLAALTFLSLATAACWLDSYRERAPQAMSDEQIVIRQLIEAIAGSDLSSMPVIGAQARYRFGQRDMLELRTRQGRLILRSYAELPPGALVRPKDMDWHGFRWRERVIRGWPPSLLRGPLNAPGDTKIVEVNIPFWAPMVLLLAYPTMHLAVVLYRRRRIPRDYCPDCGYRLAGNRTGRCPECGRRCSQFTHVNASALRNESRNTDQIIDPQEK